MSRLSSLAVAALLLTAAFPCSAAPPDDETKAAARKIAEEGLALYDSGKYQDALDRFVRADAMVHAPTMLLMAARSLVKLGKLVEAADKLAAASQMTLDTAASDAFRKAVADAAKEHAELLARIPTIVLTVDAPGGATPTVTIDGVAIPSGALGQKRLVEPGAHTIEARAEGLSTTARVELKEGESRPLHLVLAAPPGSTLRTVGWTALGVGAAGLVMGAVTGGLGISKNDELTAAGCKDGSCPVKVQGELGGYETLRALSSAGIIGGAVVLAAGAGILLFAPGPKPAETGARRPGAPARHATGSLPASVSPWIGFGSVGVRGAF